MEPPLDYKEAMDMVSSVMQKNGHSHLSNLCGVDPYLTRNSKNEEIRQLKEKVIVANTRCYKNLTLAYLVERERS